VDRVRNVGMDGGRMRGANMTACAPCRALDTPATSPRSWLRSAPDTAVRWPPARCRSCSCRRAHSALHGTGCLRSCSPRMRRPNGGRQMRDRAPLELEDGVMAARCNTSLASLARTVPRRAWQFANSVSQLLSSDTSGRGIWAWHTAPNVTSATRIAARLLQRTGDQSAAGMAESRSCSEGQSVASLA
jgi:hypothetical protein